MEVLLIYTNICKCFPERFDGFLNKNFLQKRSNRIQICIRGVLKYEGRDMRHKTENTTTLM
jgi:hypothetical protein